MTLEPDENGQTSGRGPENQKGNALAVASPIGVGAGVALGVAMGNIALGIAIGAAIGIAAGSAVRQRRK